MQQRCAQTSVTAPHVSSPLSTGGAGTFFERDAIAHWLAQLLVRSIPPILIDTHVIEVSVQTEHLGWHTDDFLVTCQGAGDVRQKLIGQVKRTFTVSAADEECRKAVLDFWQDYQNAGRFFAGTDRFVLLVQRGTNTLLGDFNKLLECARGARDGAEFEHRLTTPGFLSAAAARYCEQVREIIGGHEQRVLSAADVWLFLKVFHVLSLDLDTSTRQTEAHLKSLLAYTASERDGPTVATSSWNALLRVAESAMTQARTFTREDLPEELRRCHGSLGLPEDRLLRALSEHTAPILRRIRSTIGPSTHLQRAALVQQTLNELQTVQVVIVSGAAGSGKSAIGKEVMTQLASNHVTFAFRVEEFAQPHIDATLQAAQIPGNAEALAAVLAAQERKIVLIESMERLLEKSTRDAFADLLSQVRSDPGLRMVITCRDYSTEQVRDSLLREAGLTHAVVPIPPLEDAELDEIAGAIPELSVPLSHPRLRDILRNPYFLDKALAIPWPADRPMPESEREFRAYFWRHLVRVERGGKAGYGRQRKQVLEQIAIRRARALSEYIPTGDLDLSVIEGLKADSLVTSPEGSPSLIATAHDVLEDWAILEWFEEQHLADTASFAELAGAIGTHPAVRRSYRKWVAELLEREPAAADRLFTAATSDSAEGAQFRDDSLVSILRAPLAPPLLARHETSLVASDCALLKRIIHLLRVACVATPDWLREMREYGSTFNVPDGPAWPTVLKLVHDNLQRFGRTDQPLLLGLIEDAVRGVSWWAPEAPGQEFVAGIGYALLPELQGYRSDDARERLLKVLAKIPKSDPAQFEAALRGSVTEDDPRNRVAEEFQDLLLTGSEGMPAARDLPTVLVSVAADYLLTSEEEIRRDRYRHYSIEVDGHFGIRDGHRHEFFPASALRGPWVPLLQHHLRVGLNFYYQVFNHSIDWYVHPRLPEPLEPAWEIELTFADGVVQKQWGNVRLWTAYRGLSVSPYALQSMLMALEKWLLDLASVHPEHLDGLLLNILRQNQSAALSAVVASVAVAHPHRAGEALLVLLSAPDFIRLDRTRLGGESQTSALTSFLPQMQPEKKLYDEERKRSNALPHRKHDLEHAIVNLQLGPLAPRVQAILDRHTAALPPTDARTREDLLWQLALKRMDLRQYTLGQAVTVPTAQARSTDREDTTTYVPLEPTPLEPAIQVLVDECVSSTQQMNKSLGPWMWGIRVFQSEADEVHKSLWRENLTQAREADRDTEDSMGTRNGPGVVAAVCVRDHWDELSAAERTWCTSVVCSEILKTADRWASMGRVQRHNMAADRVCAAVAAVLVTKALSEPERTQARHALAAAITHSNQEVNWYAAWGVHAEVWRADRELALRCVNAIALHASRIEERWEKRERERMWEPSEVDALFADVAEEVRRLFGEPSAIPDDAHATLNLESRAGGEANARILTILAFAPAEPASVAAFERASRALVNQWDEEDKNRGQGHQRDFESEQATEDRVQRFVMRATPENAERVMRPLLEAVDRHPDEVDDIVHGLTIAEDRDPNTPQYWFLWGLFASAVKRARWLAWLDRDRPTGDGMLAAIFMTYGWKQNARHWKSVEGYAHRVDELFEALPRISLVLDDYLGFLYHIGAHSLPAAFVRISAAFKEGNALDMLTKSNTVFVLEVLLQRHVYGRPLELKQNRSVREAVLFLLDALVERGSSAAFRMRDDFVTPVT
jgi:hypothetical protein